MSIRKIVAIVASILLSVSFFGVSFAEEAYQTQGTVLEQSSFSMSEPVEETAVQATITPTAAPAPAAEPAANAAPSVLEQSSYSDFAPVDETAMQQPSAPSQTDAAAFTPEYTANQPQPTAAPAPVERSAQIHVNYPDHPQYGDTVTLTATLTGYENTVVTVLWQYSYDGQTWVDATGEGADTTMYSFQVSAETASTFWRLAVTAQ